MLSLQIITLSPSATLDINQTQNWFIHVLNKVMRHAIYLNRWGASKMSVNVGI